MESLYLHVFIFATLITDSDRRPFSDEVNASGDVESLVTPGAKEAYSALIDGMASKTESSESLSQQQQQRTPRSAGHLSTTEEENIFVYPQQHSSRFDIKLTRF